ncbi:DNA polymerase III subunit gamma/tau [Acinetobacter junii]|uniref:DNA polymerase III subunit gamma/tau n=1 Tax=Acinetobacter junii TaxID=40215 RepID=UPI0009503982|nr:DNA polymerase III subunit gamma/tau [Acinetobacter junii]APU48622.1 DNA polymerase III subunit gamma/tau [Acinetobacter junii]QXR09569.1 DNA polymerase III subunit gamma/tau [Acinetobacter junii]TIE05692.1 DNA polymerase III subunit gamma/tau [Acinetobacter junii]
MYQVLARKYRPRNFNELVGQNHVSRALTSALERGRLHHAYLFTGTRGVGKTTIARILAKCLNCETGVTSTPCEVCATCRAVNEGRFIDLIEIDAASRTKVEDTRELLDNVPYAPTQGRFKVYLIDEVHMLSTHSFNALLKTLEEPPEHVKFLFATTDPQKLPITVISRCLQFTLRPLAVDEITTHLTTILDKESINADRDAIWQIAESAQGSLRDALSLTDQAIAYGQGAVHHQDVKEMLGLIDRTIIYDLILAIHQNQQARVSQLLLQFRQQALDVSLVLDQLVSTLHELALLQYLPDLALKYSEEINRKILQLSKLISAQDLQLYYQIACKGRSDIQLAVTQEQGFEMIVLRLLAFRPMQLNEVTVKTTSVTPISINETQQFSENVKVENLLAVRSEVVNVEPEPEPEPESEPVAESGVMVFDAAEGQLIGLETTSPLEKPVSNSGLSEAEDFLVFPVSPDEAAQDSSVSDLDINTQITHDLELFENTPVVEDVEPYNTVIATTKQSHENEPISNLSPQDILKLKEQSLEGEWNLEKWEYWFRNSELSPAVQELAQHGLMTGEINGKSVFHIPQEYEGMLTQLQHALEDALKSQWINTQFSVQYRKMDSVTPFVMQATRKQKAFDRAVELLNQEPTIKSLIETFDAELANVQLKP